MEKVTRESLLDKTNSVFKLCNLAALRAMELNRGDKKLVDANPNEKLTTTAIREIAAGKIGLKTI